MNGKQRQFVPLRVARAKLGISGVTLRDWADRSLISSIRTPGGKRLFDVDGFVANKYGETTQAKDDTKQSICYCRVSSVGQKDDLARQIDHMRSRFPNHRIVSDVGSGINFRRRGLRALLELVCSGGVSEVVVAHRDRLCRFAFELLEWLFHHHSVQLLVLNENVESASLSNSGELAEDLLAIINVFNCRINGRRKYGKRKQRTDGGEQLESSQVEAAP